MYLKLLKSTKIFKEELEKISRKWNRQTELLILKLVVLFLLESYNIDDIYREEFRNK